ncbi:MAG: HAMP domain-containing protein [Chloroflexi bacterium]|nr:HAMP domain-containing protein [Chloroflexota bacterium]
MRRIWQLRHSLATKLILAFLLVGLIGISLVALLVVVRTRSEFSRFLSERDRTALANALAEHYAATGSWQGLSQALDAQPALIELRQNVVLVDANGAIINSLQESTATQTMQDILRFAGEPIVVDQQTVGYMLPHPIAVPNPELPPPSPEQDFLARVTWAATASASAAILLALLIGALLAQTLTRPIRALITATHKLADGTFDHRVTVQSHDEVGQLAQAFNQMSAKLARASQQRQQMTADLAHDIRTPLSILRSYTEGLKDQRFAGSPTIYNVLHEEVEHLQRLVEDLRVLSLADAGELVLNRRIIDPRAILERVGLAHIMQAEAQGIALTVEASDQLPSIDVDTDRMTQVLNNLVSNALRYASAGAITLGAQQRGDQVLITVQDTGSGIDAADLPFIFDRLYRADKARQRNASSTSGLGLAIAKAIVEAHAGTISVDSRVGSGTTFTISLSVANPHAQIRPKTT